jgi:hypothetical protein
MKSSSSADSHARDSFYLLEPASVPRRKVDRYIGIQHGFQNWLWLGCSDGLHRLRGSRALRLSSDLILKCCERSAWIGAFNGRFCMGRFWNVSFLGRWFRSSSSSHLRFRCNIPLAELPHIGLALALPEGLYLGNVASHPVAIIRHAKGLENSFRVLAGESYWS